MSSARQQSLTSLKESPATLSQLTLKFGSHFDTIPLNSI